MRLFHLTDPGNVESIMQGGLKANGSGLIYTVSNLLIANKVASTQLFLQEYAIVVIRADEYEDHFEDDPVAEITSVHHVVIRYPCIPPQHLSNMGVFKTTPELTMWDYYANHVHFGFTKQESDWYQEWTLQSLEDLRRHEMEMLSGETQRVSTGSMSWKEFRASKQKKAG